MSFISFMSVCGAFVSLWTIGLFVSFVFVVVLSLLFCLLVVIFFDLAKKGLQSFKIVRPSTPFSNRSMTEDTEVIHP